MPYWSKFVQHNLSKIFLKLDWIFGKDDFRSDQRILLPFHPIYWLIVDCFVPKFTQIEKNAWILVNWCTIAGQQHANLCLKRQFFTSISWLPTILQDIFQIFSLLKNISNLKWEINVKQFYRVVFHCVLASWRNSNHLKY